MPRFAKTQLGSTRFQTATTDWRWKTQRFPGYRLRRSSRSVGSDQSPTPAHLGKAMRPRPKLEVLPPVLRQHDPGIIDAFDEDCIRQDLARFAQAPGLFTQ